METAFGIILGALFVLIYPAILIIGFGIAVGIAAAIPPVLVSLLIFVLEAGPKAKEDE